MLDELSQLIGNGNTASDYFGWFGVIVILILTGIGISAKKVREGSLTVNEALRFWSIIIGAILFFWILFWLNN